MEINLTISLLADLINEMNYAMDAITENNPNFELSTKVKRVFTIRYPNTNKSKLRIRGVIHPFRHTSLWRGA
jgi:hypothetical protein